MNTLKSIFPRYEYKIEIIHYQLSESVESALNKFGLLGWKLIAVESGTTAVTTYFMREIH